MANTESNILITQPVSITIYTIIACVFTLSICALFYFGEYAQKQKVVGVLMPDKGLLKIYSPEPATVVTINVKEGEEVEKGQLLYTLSSSRVSVLKEDSRLEIREQFKYQLDVLSEEEKKQYESNLAIEESINKKIHEINKELDLSKSTLLLINSQAEIAKANLQSYQLLADKGLYSKIQVKEKQIEIINYEAQLKTIERQIADLNARAASAMQEHTSLTMEGKKKLSEIKRNKDSVLQRLLGTDYERDIQITAPVSGIVTGIALMPGQQSSGETPLLSILPSGSVLQAHLFAPSNSISFIKPGSKVLLRYKAFPYQKFGQQVGTVDYISKAALPVSEIGVAISGADSHAQSVYRITVRLPEQYMVAYGSQESLQVGMELDAYISLGARRIYEWIFEPLFSITG